MDDDEHAPGMVEDDRQAKAAERDAAIPLILARGGRTVRAALGVATQSSGGGTVSDAEVRKAVLRTLRLLHPDFTINIPLKGTKKHMRIEAAFKKLRICVVLGKAPSRNLGCAT